MWAAAACRREEESAEVRVGSGRARGGQVSRLGGKPGAQKAGGGQTGGEGGAPVSGQRRKKGKQWVDLIAKGKPLTNRSSQD